MIIGTQKGTLILTTTHMQCETPRLTLRADTAVAETVSRLLRDELADLPAPKILKPYTLKPPEILNPTPLNPEPPKNLKPKPLNP